MTNGSFLDNILEQVQVNLQWPCIFIMVIIKIKPIPIISFLTNVLLIFLNEKLKKQTRFNQFSSCTIFSASSYPSLKRYHFLVRNKNSVKSFASRTQSILIVSGFKSISHKAINGKFQQL